MHYVYKITNIINQKFYIGKHTHKYGSDTYMGSGVHLKRAMKKYGRENFVKTILEYNENPEINALREKEIIGDLWLKDECYNLRSGGNATYFEHSISSREKMSKSKIGIIFSEEHCENIRKSKIGVKPTFETKIKMSIAGAGKVYKTTTCTHCNKIGGINTMKRWHFEKCKKAQNVNY